MEMLKNVQNSTVELQKNIAMHLRHLAEETDNARRSEDVSRYLEFCAKFYKYSANNVWLILLQRPDSSHVAGYHAWQKLGRYVMRGEKGIGILAPVVVKVRNMEGEEENRLISFKTAYVYDLTQTSGKPLPAQPIWKSLGQNDELRRRLMNFAASKSISVTYEDFHDDTQGASLGGKIVLSPSSGVKTLAHELVHELLHQVGKNMLSHLERELEAESASFIVCRYFGMTDLASPKYNALQGATGEMILQHFQRILGAAKEIVNYVENLK